MPPRRTRSTASASRVQANVENTRKLRKRPTWNRESGRSSTDNTACIQDEKISKPNETIGNRYKYCGKHTVAFTVAASDGIDDVNKHAKNNSERNTEYKHMGTTRYCKRQKVDENITEVCNSDTITSNTDVEGQSSDIDRDQFLQTLLRTGLQPRHEEPKVTVTRPRAERSKNLLYFFEQCSIGRKCSTGLQQSVVNPLLGLLSELQLHRVASPFDRRVTALEWHPTRPSILAAASKGGDIILWDTEKVDKGQFVKGIGKAGSHQGMKFWPWDLDKVVTASIDGTVLLHDFEGRQGQVLADTGDAWGHWYCSLDVNASRYLVAAGRNRGVLHLMSTEGRKVFEGRLHKNKVTHVEFSPREDWLLCTASVDQTAQLWDVRMLKDRTSALHVLQHEKPVNSAYFSRTDGCRLVTTDQQNEIRVYTSPGWHLERTVLHPHRFFQHITPIKATWHPLQDLIVCGRYPDSNFPGYQDNERRTIDVIDANTGRTVTQLQDPGAVGITCLNKFNRSGDALASGTGYHVLLWNRKYLVDAKEAQLREALNSSLSGSQRSNNSGHTRPRNRPASHRPGTRGKKGKEKATKQRKDTEIVTKEAKVKLIVKKDKMKDQ